MIQPRNTPHPARPPQSSRRVRACSDTHRPRFRTHFFSKDLKSCSSPSKRMPLNSLRRPPDPKQLPPGSPKTERLHQLPPRTPRPLSVTHNSAAARPRETGPRGFSNSTQIFADLADQHGFRRVFLKRRQRRGRIDSGAHVVDTQESNQRKSVQSVVIRVPFESLGEPLNRESRDVCKRQPSTLVPRLSTLAHDPSSLPLR